jgi:hypothetical protein
MTKDIVFHWAPAAETIDIELAGVLVLPELNAAATRLFTKHMEATDDR